MVTENHLIKLIYFVLKFYKCLESKKEKDNVNLVKIVIMMMMAMTMMKAYQYNGGGGGVGRQERERVIRKENMKLLPFSKDMLYIYMAGGQENQEVNH